MHVYDSILEKKSKGRKQLAVLIDPDKADGAHVERLCELFAREEPDYVFVGGSLVTNDIRSVVARLKAATSVPVVLFPGDSTQVVAEADAILLLSLISGRNAEFLIGQHVRAAMQIKRAGLEVVPTGYMLIDGGSHTAVEYISGTKPIPHCKDEIAVATAVAGEQLGMKMLYLEAGSGAKQAVGARMIEAVKSVVDIPVIVGGGLRTEEQIREACEAGADMVVVGSAIEENVESFEGICSVVRGM